LMYFRADCFRIGLLSDVKAGPQKVRRIRADRF
jgi:hypothetical protein